MYQQIEKSESSESFRKFMRMIILSRRKHCAHAFQAKFIQAYDKVYQFALN